MDKIKTIKLSELDTYFKIIEIQRELTLKLNCYHNKQKEMLKTLKQIKNLNSTANKLKNIIQYQEIINKELQKEINKILKKRYIEIK